MDKLSKVTLKPLEKSNYIKPLSMNYLQNGVAHQWDFLTIHNSVSIILHNISRNVLVFVKQFRPPVYIANIPEQDRTAVIDLEKYPAKLGFTIECCAGIVDKPLSLAEIAAEEVFEECGYKVEASKLEKVATFRSGVGISGSLQTMYYCEITDDMKVTQGGGVVGEEIIEVVEMSIPELKSYLQSDVILSPPEFLFVMHWFLLKKSK